MTSQQLADRDLAVWQAHRDLTPEQRMEILLYDMMLSPPPCEALYEVTLRLVSEEMRAA